MSEYADLVASVTGPVAAEPTAAVIEPLDVDPPRPTGDARVDGALSILSRVGDLPTDAHGPVYEDVHRGLRDTLAELDR
ncbi:hypothetical protein [Embleya sp. NBC_00896]|uniref:hypothetical protein n=1 Tax=Embleya sp. NBC_00896 TaxID=2975961 RepID=UPI0038692085|nr:hypothetical protein OG928_25585 [Embleya sp. NBC_00896]